ncbi:MAG: S46 family peptidase [Bacteroidales bacterium]
MKSTKSALLLVFITLLGLFARADEGMWLPMLINKYNINTMQKMGLKLTADQIYSVNQACLKDAIVSLDHGSCTGSIISQKGLLITNHHCGYGDIAEQSTVGSDFLTDGFWAMRPEEELPIAGKTVSFLVRMEDVTSRVLANIKPGMDEGERGQLIQEESDKIIEETKAGSGLEVSVESMFEGNEYYLFVYQTFTDVRMVGAPPSSIGKFGGDTDNWMWPRHTGDFCLLRVYSGKDGKPALYAKDNVPFQPAYSLPVSMAGVKEDDFSMILGYPGSTDRYLTSYGIQEKLTLTNPADVKAKWAKMEVIKNYMGADEQTRIAYAEDYAYLANFWKKSLQESKALQRLKVFDDKKRLEDEFEAWVNQDSDRKAKYGNVISDFKTVYASAAKSRAGEAVVYAEELLMGSKILYSAFQTGELASRFDSADFSDMVNSQKERAEKFYKHYNPYLEKELLRSMLELYENNVASDFIPDVYRTINKKFKWDIGKYVDYLFENSIFASEASLMEFLEHPKKKTLEKDPAYIAVNSFIASYMIARLSQMTDEDKFDQARRLFIAGLREMNPDALYYPDANSTMRLTYGSVKPYKPADALFADYYTTLQGVMEKEDSTSEEFIVPAKLKQLYQQKDFGRYADNGTMRVCFISTQDITGGNSGSPVLNGNGQLTGLAFDGNSEAMSSDIKYDVNLQRTICVDIRYVLFIIDKYAGAGYLLDEMKLVN